MRTLLTLAALLLAASAAIAGTVTVAWTAPTACSDGSPVAGNRQTSSYRIYSGPCGQPKTTVLATPAATATSTDITLAPGKQCLDMTTLAGSAESAHSGEVSVTLPFPAPSPPGNVTASVKAGSTTAYKMRQSVDGFAFVAIGTLPGGTPCDASHNVDGYSLVARAAVSLASRFDTLPLLVFAQCS